MTETTTTAPNQKSKPIPLKATPPAKILETAEPRFMDKNIPSWLSYTVTFLAFPLNMMLISLTFFLYAIFVSANIYLRTSCLLYTAWMVLWDRKRCDGVGYPTNQFPFNQLRYWVRNNWLYAGHCAYFPLKLHKLAELPAKDSKTGENCQYLFTCHPHGVIGVGTMAVFATDECGFTRLYPGIDPYTTGLRQIFYAPFFRDWCLLGGLLSADKSSFRHIFEVKKASAVINLGGAAEAFIGLGLNPATGNTVMKLLLKDRKGFCKLALQHGVSLVPVISFEEHLLFDLLRLPEKSVAGNLLFKFQLYLQKHVFGFAPLMVWGNKWPFMPKRQELNVFVGKAIPCATVIPNPMQEDIDAKHEEYCAALETMFHGCKKLVKGCEDWELELIEHPFKSITAATDKK